MKQVKITVPDDIFARLEDEAAKVGKKKAEVAKSIVLEHFAGDSLRNVRLKLKDVEQSLDELREASNGGGEAPSNNERRLVNEQLAVLALGLEFIMKNLLRGAPLTDELRDKFDMLKTAYRLKD